MTAALSHNGGRTQFNSNFLTASGEFPFLDLMKTSGTWGHITGGTAITPSELDSNGYPTAIVSGGYSKIVPIPSQLARSGNYKLTWDGSGTISLGGATLATGSLSTSGCTIAISSNNATTITIGITATTGLTNLKLFHVNDETDVLAGNIVGNKFKQRVLTEMKCGVIRFLNWQGSNSAGANNSTISTWASRRPVGYTTYGGQEQRSSIYAGTTVTSGALNSDNAITFTDPVYGSGAPQDKQTITLQFQTSMTDTKATVTFTSGTNTVNWTNSLANGMLVAFDINTAGALPANITNVQQFFVINRTATTIQLSLTSGGSVYALGSSGSGDLFGNIVPTLNLNSTGAVAIYTQRAAPIGSSNRPVSGRFATLFYDAAINVWLKLGGDGLNFDQFMTNGCPPEIMVQFAAELGMHPYFVTPAWACDPATDFMSSLATYIKNNGPAWMIPRFEGPNELWNNAAGFVQTAYSNAKQTVYAAQTGNSTWTSTGGHNWMGRVMSQLGQALAGVYGLGNLSRTYHVLCGVQTVAFTALPIHSQDPRVTADLYVSTQGGISAQAYISHICCAQYMSPSIKGTLGTPNATEQSLAASFNGVSASVTISGSVMTIASTFASGGLTSAGGVTVGQFVYGVGIPAGTTIASFGTGTGFAGTYNLSQSVPANITTAQTVNIGGDLATYPTQYVGFLTGSSVPFTVEYLTTLYTNVATWASGFGLKMCGYEGGYSPDYTGSDASASNSGRTLIDILKAAGKGTDKLREKLTANYNAFTTAGGVFPSCFQLGGTQSSSNVWSVYEDVYVPQIGSDPTPQAVAISLFNNNKRRFIVKTG